MTPYYDRNRITIYCGNCLEMMPKLNMKFGLILTDPPYPGYHTDKWKDTSISFLDDFSCQQIVFWSAILSFPLTYTSVHIWDKKINGLASSEYERIFERNGGRLHKVFNHYFINSTVAANYNRDIFTGHPSQKPRKLIAEIIIKLAVDGLIIDPFMGSGTTLVVAQNEGRQAIGIELSEEYCKIAVERLRQPSFFSLPDTQPKKKLKQLSF